MSDTCTNPDCGHGKHMHTYDDGRMGGCLKRVWVHGPGGLEKCPCKVFVGEKNQLIKVAKKSMGTVSTVEGKRLSGGGLPDDHCWCGSSPPCLEHNGPAYNVCKCGHREAWHDTPHRSHCTGQFGRCDCTTYEFDHVYPAADQAVTDMVADLLKKHGWMSSPYHWTGCWCDRLWWMGFEHIKRTEDMYRAHVAAVLSEQFVITPRENT